MANIIDVLKGATEGLDKDLATKIKGAFSDYKFVDLNEGGYIAKNKYDTEIERLKKEAEASLSGLKKASDDEIGSLKSKLDTFKDIDLEKYKNIDKEKNALQKRHSLELELTRNRVHDIKSALAHFEDLDKVDDAVKAVTKLKEEKSFLFASDSKTLPPPNGGKSGNSDDETLKLMRTAAGLK